MNNNKCNKINKKQLEKYSCAYTLSDMEIFIFPDLMYSIVLANIMSPIIWKWKKDPWFKDIDKQTPYKKILRIKQFIMDNFVFNLDLDTWGLTDKETELARFKDIINLDILKESNALFGYEGDKYYFDLDIRQHFGLDKYTSNIIPYWKTETIEAMHAFKNKSEYETGAGECVSLSALYTAALFIIGKIPLEDIFIMATPLHSQNLILVKDGIITNNRRIVTKNMWFNGTEMSAKARRALENEKVTYISHITGYIHTIYEKATINKDFLLKAKKTLNTFLKTRITIEILYNFLRHYGIFQKQFQIAHKFHGAVRYIKLEKAFGYEHSSKLKLSDNTQKKLLNEIGQEEFHLSSIKDRINLTKVEEFIKQNHIHIEKKSGYDLFYNYLKQYSTEINVLLNKLKEFTVTLPQFPDENKLFEPNEHLKITTDMNRLEIINYIKSLACTNETAKSALYCFRDMENISWQPFLKAALERNPVSIEFSKMLSIDDAYNKINLFNNTSIYASIRLAQPDEVWNFQTGDGIEKAIVFANILKNRYNNKIININIDIKTVELKFDDKIYGFISNKNLKKNLSI